MAMCVFGMAVQTVHAPKPMLWKGPVEAAVPAYYQEVMSPDNGKTLIPLGPKLAYHAPDHKKMARANAQYDAYEGQAADPTLPTDGQYETAAFPNALGGDSTSGYRWYYGPTFDYPNSIHHVNKFRTAGINADNIDFLFHVNPDTTDLNSIEFFTYNDSYNEVGDPHTFAFSAAQPSAGNTGVIFTFATPINAPSGTYPSGRTFRMNVDVSTLQSGAGFQMPSGNDGWSQVVFANATSPSLVYPSNVQPMWFGTQGTNPSMAGRWAYADGNGSSGSQGTEYYWDWSSGYWASPTSGTVTRGSSPAVGTAINVAQLSGTAGSSVVVTQALQSLISRNNAEITVTCTLDAAAYGNPLLNQYQPIVVGKANAAPLASSTFVVQMLNNTTSTYNTVYTSVAKTSNAPGISDGDWIRSVSPVWTASTYVAPDAPYNALGKITDYIATDANGVRTSSVKIGAKQLTPTLLSWKLTVNLLYINADEYGPGNTSPSICYSTNRG